MTDEIVVEADGKKISVTYVAGKVEMRIENQPDQVTAQYSITAYLSMVEARRLACMLAGANTRGNTDAQRDLTAVREAFGSWEVECPAVPAIYVALRNYGRTNLIQAIDISGRKGKAGHFGYVLAVARSLADERRKRNDEVVHSVKQAMGGE